MHEERGVISIELSDLVYSFEGVGALAPHIVVHKFPHNEDVVAQTLMNFLVLVLIELVGFGLKREKGGLHSWHVHTTTESVDRTSVLRNSPSGSQMASRMGPKSAKKQPNMRQIGSQYRNWPK